MECKPEKCTEAVAREVMTTFELWLCEWAHRVVRKKHFSSVMCMARYK